ncbi:MAG: MmcQ/YjbR family DNA-binding protein [Clostridia bacterium]|nr:MmcQ/YjbR family DNA-binding protein [Clostridia bacterium]
MTHAKLEDLILDYYNVQADYPFEYDLQTAVFRHTGTGKWFAVAMKISWEKLGKRDKSKTDIVNFKCSPEIVESLVGEERGIYPAYHMNKAHWLTAALEECDVDTVSWLLSISYDLTKGKMQNKR